MLIYRVVQQPLWHIVRSIVLIYRVVQLPLWHIVRSIVLIYWVVQQPLWHIVRSIVLIYRVVQQPLDTRRLTAEGLVCDNFVVFSFSSASGTKYLDTVSMQKEDTSNISRSQHV
jgi:hypothetical protein